MAGGKTPSLVLKRMPKVFLKVPPNELYQLENKQAKYAKLCADIRQEMEGEKGS